MRVGFSPSSSSNSDSASGFGDARIDALDLAPADDPVVRLDLHVHDRPDPVRLHRRDANARRAVGDLGGRVLLLADRLVDEGQACRGGAEASQQVAAAEARGGGCRFMVVILR